MKTTVNGGEKRSILPFEKATFYVMNDPQTGVTSDIWTFAEPGG